MQTRRLVAAVFTVLVVLMVFAQIALADDALPTPKVTGPQPLSSTVLVK